MLCSRCSSLPLTNATGRWEVQHYSTFAELAASARGGCELCALLKVALLDYFAEKLGVSVEEAERYHQRLDDHPEMGGDERFRLEESELEDGDSKDSASVVKPIPSEDSAFFVKAVLSEDSEARSRGLQGILYVRSTAGYYAPVDQIYPFVQVSSLPDSISLREWHVVGRQMTVTADISLAKHWISVCAAEHSDCHTPSSARLPRRILDLTHPDGSSDLKLRYSADLVDRYATLSHCWGRPQPLKLTQLTGSAFQDTIAYNSLPRAFQDAVSVTRSLGLRYLWIDSLCIFQDCKEDWEEQCMEMERIYRDSYVNLAGTASSGCNDGFLHPRPPSHNVTIELSDSKSRCQVVLSHHGVEESGFVQLPGKNSPLFKRAWVLQERLLSGRTLYFSTDKMYLECFTSVQFDNRYWPVLWRYMEINMISKHEFAQLLSSPNRFRLWEHVVCTYSGLHLTKATDRLPALSGLASHFQSATHAQYLAGLWREDMPRALGWYVPFWELSRPIFPPTSTYIAPSWSWAAARFRISNPNIDFQNPFHSEVYIIAARVTPADIDQFGAVKDGLIRILGRLRRGLVEERPDTTVPGRRTLYLLSAGPGSTDVGTYAPDHPSDVNSGGFDVLLLHLGTDSRYGGAAISIREVDGDPGAYRRVGLAISGSRGGFRGVFEGFRKTAIRLI